MNIFVYFPLNFRRDPRVSTRGIASIYYITKTLLTHTLASLWRKQFCWNLYSTTWTLLLATCSEQQCSSCRINNNGPNGHFNNIIMGRMGICFTSVATSRWGQACCLFLCFPTGTCVFVLHLVPFWILTIWGSVHVEETVVGWRNQLRMKTSVT